MLVARTLKGKGLSTIEGKDGWHGKALKSGEETDKAIEELEAQLIEHRRRSPPIPPAAQAAAAPSPPPTTATLPAPAYKLGDLVATREAWGTALAAVGKLDPRIVALDADVKNSTFSDRFEKVAPDRFYRDVHRRAGHGRRGDGLRRARRDSVSVDVRLLPLPRRRLHPHGRHLDAATSS